MVKEERIAVIRERWFMILLLVAGLLWGSCGFARADAVRLMIVTDPHYLSPSCYEDSKGLFQSAISQGDGKMTHYSRELLQAMEAETLHQRPDALIVTGDLTFNGEKISHEEQAESFSTLKRAGISVWVIPGNHDINNEKSRIFTGYAYDSTQNITTADFGEIYQDFLGEYDWDQSQFSYVVPLQENLWLAMCDASLYDPTQVPAGYYSEGHRTWLRKVLADAKAADAQVITATHQSVIPHTSFMMESMTVLDGEKMLADIRESGVSRLNLSGHLHLQHISENEGCFDIATGSFSVPPFRYGMLEVTEEGTIRYEARSLCTEHLPEEVNILSQDWFENTTIGKLRKNLEDLEIPEEQREAMLTYAGRLNHAYFSGELNGADPSWTEDPAYQMWADIADSYSFAAYLVGIPGDPMNQRDALQLEIAAVEQ